MVLLQTFVEGGLLQNGEHFLPTDPCRFFLFIFFTTYRFFSRENNVCTFLQVVIKFASSEIASAGRSLLGALKTAAR